MDDNLSKTALKAVRVEYWMRERVRSVGRAALYNAVLYAALCATLQPINITNIPLSSPPPISLLLLPPNCSTLLLCTHSCVQCS